MASEALKAKIAEYDDYVERKGIDKIDEDVFRAYSMAARAAIGTEHDLDYGLVITGKGKAIMERVVQHRSGVSVWELEKYAFENRTYYSLLNSYYDLLLIEAQNYQVDASF